MESTLAVGKKLIELCKQGKAAEAMETLYSPDIVSIEAGPGPGGSARVDGIAAVKGKGEWWVNNHEIHSAKAEGPGPTATVSSSASSTKSLPKSAPWPEQKSPWTKPRCTR